MECYFLPSKDLYEILKEKGVTQLFHANTVLTSKTFIENNALLSRSYVENNGLLQTSQKSDDKDKEYNVWDDVFLDAIDLHKRYKKANNYGPVIFILKLEILLSKNLSEILVTKNNPMFWTATTVLEDRYYSSIEDVKENYLSGKRLDSRIMLTFRSPEKAINLSEFVEIIGIDKPNIIVDLKSGGRQNVGEFAYGVIKTAINENGLSHIPVVYRHSSGNLNNCICNWEYAEMFKRNFQEFNKRFNPAP